MAEQKEKVSLTRKPAFWIAVVVILALAVGGYAYYWFKVKPFESTDDAFIDAHTVQMSSQISGRITQSPIDDNAHVDAGQLLAEINAESVDADLALAKARLGEAEASVLQAQVGVRQAEAQTHEAQAQLRALEVQEQSAQDTLRRDQKLAKRDSNILSEQELIRVRDEAKVASARVDGQRKAVETARTGVEAAKAKVEASKAALKAARTQVDTAAINVDYAIIKAPVAGHVVQIRVRKGSYVTPGSTMMALVPDHLYVTANFKETQLQRIRIGQNVDIEVDAYPDKHFTGKVLSIQRGAGQAFQLLPPQNATGNFVKVVQRVPVKISINQADASKFALGPGMSVIPSVRVEEGAVATD